MRKIDVFTHVFPTAYAERMERVAPNWKDVGKRVRGVPMLYDLDVRFRAMDQFPGYEQVLSIATPPIEAYAGPADAVDLARLANDGMADLVRRHPARFPAFVASLPMNDPDAAILEAHRAVRDLGARGVQVFSNACGVPISAPQFYPIFEALASYDLPIWLHPYRGASMPDFAAEQQSEFEIWWTFGWPYETSAAMARLVFSGLFDKLPDVKIITHHMGAMIPYFEGRVGPGWDQLGTRTSDVDLTQVLRTLKKRPADYFHMFYADTALFGSLAATICGLEYFGVDRVLFASDSPFDPEKGTMYIRETLAVIDRLPVTDRAREDLYWRNAARLLRLDGANRS